MDRLLRLGGSVPGLSQAPPPPNDAPVVDTAEQVYISSLALLKMLKHGRAGVPMEVMGLMLGEFVDDYTVRVIDVFAMPQTGTVSYFCTSFSSEYGKEVASRPINFCM
jgi:26S proteasome regulatory subunit N11